MPKDNKYWENRWENNEISWHTAKPHSLLIDSLSKLNLNKQETIFVPLCGASIDMLYLAQKGYYVIGNEISPLACERFFNENEIPYEKNRTCLFYFIRKRSDYSVLR